MPQWPCHPHPTGLAFPPLCPLWFPVAALERIRDANTNRSSNWQRALKSWTCPTDPINSDQTCDPCSKDWSGNWEHMHCRGSGGRWGEGSDGNYDGYVTTIHGKGMGGRGMKG